MDIVTHVMMGAAATSPLWESHPLESVTLVFGSMLPGVGLGASTTSWWTAIGAFCGSLHRVRDHSP